jgi:protocatechuate 4,5-dioxygenase beta chain
VGKIVGGFLVPHDPVMFVAPDAPAEGVRKRMWAAFDSCAQRLAALRPTSVVIIGADHYLNFGTDCLPQYIIGTGDVDGPLDVLPGLKRQIIPTSQPLARFISQHGRDNGFDWAEARAFTVDHAVAIPDRLIVEPARQQGQQIGTIPVYIAAGVDPFIRMRRAIELGGAIKAAVEAAAPEERVVVIGSGGISHWVGTAEMGRVNEAFDREIMGYACDGNLDGMANLSDEYILAMPGSRGEIIDYAAVPEWVTGLGFVQLFA